MKKNILIVVAHPDDEILGCGGFISRFKKQSNFKVLIIAEGSSCRFKKLFKEKKEIQKKIELRKNQAKKALALFSVKDVTFCDLPCGSLNSIPSIRINQLIEEQIKLFKPEKILTHSSEDLHPDHRAVFHSVMQATRPIKKDNFVKEILSFEILSSSEWAYSSIFKPNYFIKLSKKNVNEKWKALKCYTEEIQKKPLPRSSFGINTLASFRGIQSGNEFAEAYYQVRSIK
tara:strand:+ start:1443 stop:2132 length:690 start_codon:yes stop_codon:yes gene_type:complete